MNRKADRLRKTAINLDSLISHASRKVGDAFRLTGRLHQWGSAFELKRYLGVHPPAWRDALASPTSISQSMQDLLADDGLLMLHRSKWRCLARSYSTEIERLIARVEHAYSNLAAAEEQESMRCKLVAPLVALKMAVWEAVACMQDCIPSSLHHRTWLVSKALTQVMSSDVVDVHLHHFLWVLSTVREQIFMRITDFAELEACQNDVALQTNSLRAIWKDVDAKDDLRIAQDLLTNLKRQRPTKGTDKTQQVVNFLLQKLSQVEESQAQRNHLWINSDQFEKKGRICNDECIEIDQVEWLGGCFVLKRFKKADSDLFGTQTGTQDLFNREAAIQAMVCHSHVLPLVCCTREPPAPGLLMELMQEDLTAFMSKRRKRVPLSMAVDVMLQIAKGMEYLHRDGLGIIHRDLKSHNILVNSIGGSQVHLKIADFGVSKARSVSTCIRDQGTSLWMAPEVYDSNVGGYSNKVDVYSFGMVCYEILMGKLPFEGPNVKERVLAGERPKLPPHCPPALSSFIQKCWDKEPSARPTFTHICRMLRYIKACIFLQDGHDAWLHSPGIDIGPINDRIHHSLAGFTSEPILPVLSIPREMLFCTVAVHKPEFLERFRSLYENHI